MTDKFQEPAQEPIAESAPKAENPVIEENVISPTPKKSNKNFWIISGIVISVICICSILCIALVVLGVGKINEIASNDILTTTPDILAPTQSPECGQPNLTPEKCGISGAWIGTSTVTQVGECAYLGNPTESVKMILAVEESGNLIITFPDYENNLVMTGNIDSDLKIRVQANTIANTCNDRPHTWTATLNGYIIIEGENLTLFLEGNEEWCPSCIFHVQYKAQKTKNAP